MWRNRPVLFFSFLCLIGAFGLGVPLLLGWYVLTKKDELIVSPNKVQWVHGILSKTYVEVEIKEIRTLRVHQTPIQRILRSGLLQIYTAGDQPEIFLKGLPNPTLIREIINDKRSHNNDLLNV